MPAPVPEIVRGLIVQMRQSGKTTSEIAEDTGYSQATISRILRRPKAIVQVSDWDQLSPGVQEEVRKLHSKGYSQTYLSQKYGVPLGSLGKVLPKSLEFHMKTGLARLEIVGENLIEEYQQTPVGMRDLAARYGVHERTVRYFLQSRNLVKQTGSQPGDRNHQYKGHEDAKKERDNIKYWTKQVVQSALGQKLPAGYVVHHMNENPSDQTLTNLWIFQCNADHLKYHQRQLLSLQQGGLHAPSQLARDNGGLWLPEIVSRLQVQHDTELQSLFDRPEMQTQDLLVS